MRRQHLPTNVPPASAPALAPPPPAVDQRWGNGQAQQDAMGAHGPPRQASPPPANAEPAHADVQDVVQRWDSVRDRVPPGQLPDGAGAIRELHRMDRDNRVLNVERTPSGARANFEPESDRIQIQPPRRAGAGTEAVFHEAIHAEQHRRYPNWAEVRSAAAAQHDNLELQIAAGKWMAWAEYWAYRQSYEFHQLQSPDPTAGPNAAHEYAIAQQGVRHHLAGLASVGVQYDPNTPSPPIYRVRRNGRRSEVESGESDLLT